MEVQTGPRIRGTWPKEDELPLTQELLEDVFQCFTQPQRLGEDPLVETKKQCTRSCIGRGGTHLQWPDGPRLTPM